MASKPEGVALTGKADARGITAFASARHGIRALAGNENLQEVQNLESHTVVEKARLTVNTNRQPSLTTKRIRDSIAPAAVRLRHPLECRPFRPQDRPVWQPKRRDPRDAGQQRSKEVPFRQRTRLVAAKGLGAIRINFRYASFQSMMAAHSEKAGRDQFFEGHHEAYGFRLHEIHPVNLDLQYQPLQLEWENLVGTRHHMTFDWAVELQDHSIVLGEDKASEEYFADPELEERLNFAEAFLETMGAKLERRVAANLPTQIERRVVKDIYDARRTEFGDDHTQRVHSLIRDAGGTSTMGRVLNAVGEHIEQSEAIIYGMMHQRLLAMPISAPPMLDTPITIPPQATKGALRTFLAQYIPA